MIKIGIIGSDNSHAGAFSKLVNIPDKITGNLAYPDMRVTSICDKDIERAKQIAHENEIEHVYTEVAQMLPNVDTAIIVHRHGGLHYKNALPFIRAGKPLFIDKPITVDYSEAASLMEEAKKYGSLITGGSTVKFTKSVQILKAVVQNPENGKPAGGITCFLADPESQYGGLFFYGMHNVEMSCEIFGYDIRSVFAMESDHNITALCNYGSFITTINFTKSECDNYCLAYTEKQTICVPLDISNTYNDGFEHYANMLRHGMMSLSYDELLIPVKVMNGICLSLAEKREVCLEEIR